MLSKFFFQRLYLKALVIVVFLIVPWYLFFLSNPLIHVLNGIDRDNEVMLSAMTFHGINLSIHVVNSLLTFAIAILLGLSSLGAGIAAILFGIHPISFSKVLMADFQQELFSGMFLLLSVCCYLIYLRRVESFKVTKKNLSVEKKNKKTRMLQSRVKNVWLFCSMIATLGVGFFRGPVIVLPVIFILLDAFTNRKKTLTILLEKIPFVVVVALSFFVFNSWSLVLMDQSVVKTFFLFVWQSVMGLSQILFPWLLNVRRPVLYPIDGTIWAYQQSLLVFLGLVLLCFKYRQNRWMIFSLGYYVVFSLVASLGSLMFERNFSINSFLYLSSIGVLLGVGCFAQRLWEGAVGSKWKILRYFFVIQGVLILGSVVFLSILVGKMSRQPIVFWRYHLLTSSDDAYALTQLGNEYVKHPSFEKIKNQYIQFQVLTKGGQAEKDFKNPRPTLSKVSMVTTLYSKAIEIQPQDIEAYYQLGKLHLKLMEPQKAVEFLLKGIHLNSAKTPKDIFYFLGREYQQLGEPVLAIESYKKAIQTDLDNSGLYLNVLSALSQGMKSSSKEVSQLYRLAGVGFVEELRALAQLKQEPQFYYKLGLVYYHLESFNESKAAFEIVLDRSPNDENALFYSGLVYVALSDTSKALERFEKVLKINSKHLRTLVEMGSLFGRLGDIKKAKEYYLKAIHLNPRQSQLYFNLAYFLEVSGQLNEAVSYYQKSIEVDPNQPEVFYNLGNIQATLGNNGGAIEAYLKTVMLDPSHMNAFVNLSILYFREKDYKAAVKYCNEARILGYEAPPDYLELLEQYQQGLEDQKNSSPNVDRGL